MIDRNLQPERGGEIVFQSAGVGVLGARALGRLLVGPGRRRRLRLGALRQFLRLANRQSALLHKNKGCAA